MKMINIGMSNLEMRVQAEVESIVEPLLRRNGHITPRMINEYFQNKLEEKDRITLERLTSNTIDLDGCRPEDISHEVKDGKLIITLKELDSFELPMQRSVIRGVLKKLMAGVSEFTVHGTNKKVKFSRRPILDKLISEISVAARQLGINI